MFQNLDALRTMFALFVFTLEIGALFVQHGVKYLMVQILSIHSENTDLPLEPLHDETRL